MLHIDLGAIQVHWNYMQKSSDDKKKQLSTIKSQHWWKEAGSA